MPMHFTVTYTKFQNTPEFVAFVHNLQIEKKTFFFARDFVQIKFLLSQSFLVQLKTTREAVGARVAEECRRDGVCVNATLFAQHSDLFAIHFQVISTF